jgi:flagellin
MRINTNIPSLNTQRILGMTGQAVARNIGRLSSGYRINRAADDAAGLGIANKLRADVRSLRQAARNAEQANSLLNVAEGATQTVASILDRMKELATQAASDNVDDAGRGRIKSEWDQLTSEIQAIVDTTKFQGKALLDGTFGNAVDTNVANSTVLAAASVVYDASIAGTAAGTFTISNPAAGTVRITDGSVTQDVVLTASGKQNVSFTQFGVTIQLEASYDNGVATNTFGDLVVTAGASGGSFLVRSSGDYSGQDLVSMSSLNLDTTAAAGLNLDSATFTGNGTAAEWQSAMSVVDTAVGVVSGVFGSLGAAQSRIDYATANVRTSIENIAAAESTIRDADMAAEMTEFTKNQILQQAGVAMLAQANAAPQLVLSLLQ